MSRKDSLFAQQVTRRLCLELLNAALLAHDTVQTQTLLNDPYFLNMLNTYGDRIALGADLEGMRETVKGLLTGFDSNPMHSEALGFYNTLLFHYGKLASSKKTASDPILALAATQTVTTSPSSSHSDFEQAAQAVKLIENNLNKILTAAQSTERPKTLADEVKKLFYLAQLQEIMQAVVGTINERKVAKKDLPKHTFDITLIKYFLEKHSVYFPEEDALNGMYTTLRTMIADDGSLTDKATTEALETLRKNAAELLKKRQQKNIGEIAYRITHCIMPELQQRRASEATSIFAISMFLKINGRDLAKTQAVTQQITDITREMFLVANTANANIICGGLFKPSAAATAAPSRPTECRIL